MYLCHNCNFTSDNLNNALIHSSENSHFLSKRLPHADILLSPENIEKLTCGICDETFEPYPTMRKGSTPKPYWCKPCQDEFDSIDWEEIYQQRQDGES
jgi:protein-arginine kinase activator protein McsA